MDSMEATAPSTTCPSCGYSRTGIEHDARCPECGAAGFSGAFVIEGIVVRPFAARGSFALLLVALLGIPAIVGMAAVLRQDILPLEVVLLVLVLFALFALVVWSFRPKRGGTAETTSSNARWVIHPGGVIVVARGRTRRIPQASIARLSASDSLIGPVTQLVLHPRVFSIHRITGEQVIYLRGTGEERHSLARRAEEVLGCRSPRTDA
jgi:hypothetical protein